MTRALRIIGWALGASLLLGAALVAAAAAMAGSMEPMTIQIDGEPLVVAQLGAAQWVLAIGGAVLALLVVIPLAVLLPLGIAAVVLAGVLLTVAGVAAIVCSPLILLIAVIWLMVRLARRSKQADGATMTG